MWYLYVVLAVVLTLSIAGGLARIHRGPTLADRLLVAQLFGTTGTAILLLLSEAFDLPGAQNVAVIFVLLALVNVFTFVHGARGSHLRSEE